MKYSVKLIIKIKTMKHLSKLIALTFFIAVFTQSCNTSTDTNKAENESMKTNIDTAEYFNLRPALEKQYGYTHAVKIGNELIISGAVSMTDSGVVIGAGDMELQMKNCYVDLRKILQHYGYTYDDVFKENVYTTNMKAFERVSGYRNSIYKKQFPTGTWLEVKGLALDNQLIEIDMEARK